MIVLALHRLAIPAVAVLILAAGDARAGGPFPDNLNADDRRGLGNFEALRGRAIETARAKGEAADLRHLERALEGSAINLPASTLVGNWRCRSIQFTPYLPVIAYGEFRCRITDGPAGLRLEKLTGSQRTSGTFYDLGEARLGYAGAEAWDDGEKPYRYDQDPERNQVGYLAPVSASHLRLELLDRRGTGFSILDLRR